MSAVGVYSCCRSQRTHLRAGHEILRPRDVVRGDVRHGIHLVDLHRADGVAFRRTAEVEHGEKETPFGELIVGQLELKGLVQLDGLRVLVDFRLELAATVGKEIDLEERIGRDLRADVAVGKVIDRDDGDCQCGEELIVEEREGDAAGVDQLVVVKHLLLVEFGLESAEIVVDVAKRLDAVQAGYFDGFHATDGTSDGIGARGVGRLANERTRSVDEQLGVLVILVEEHLHVDWRIRVVDGPCVVGLVRLGDVPAKGGLPT